MFYCIGFGVKQYHTKPLHGLIIIYFVQSKIANRLKWQVCFYSKLQQIYEFCTYTDGVCPYCTYCKCMFSHLHDTYRANV